MRTVNASSSNTSPDLGAKKMPVGLAVEASKSLGVAYSEAKLERRGGWRIWMEVRRSEEEEEEEGRWSGGWGWESKRGRKKREREAKEIYRAKKEKHVFTVAAAASRCRSSSFVFTPSCGVTPVQSLKKAAGWKQDLIQRRRRMKYIYIKAWLFGSTQNLSEKKPCRAENTRQREDVRVVQSLFAFQFSHRAAPQSRCTDGLKLQREQ